MIHAKYSVLPVQMYYATDHVGSIGKCTGQCLQKCNFSFLAFKNAQNTKIFTQAENFQYLTGSKMTLKAARGHQVSLIYRVKYSLQK